MTNNGTIHVKLLLGLTLAFSSGVIWAIEAVVAQPETALERMFNSFMGNLPTLIASLLAAWLALKAGNKAAAASAKVDANTELTKATNDKVEAVGKVVDDVAVVGEKTERQTNSHLESLTNKILALEAVIAKNQEASDKRNDMLQAESDRRNAALQAEIMKLISSNKP